MFIHSYQSLVHAILNAHASCYSLSYLAYSFYKRFQVVNLGGHKSQALRIDVLRPTGPCYVVWYIGLDPYPLYKILLSTEGHEWALIDAYVLWMFMYGFRHSSIV